MNKLLALVACFFLVGCSNSYAFTLNREDRADIAKEERIYFKVGIAEEPYGEKTINSIGWSGVNQYGKRFPSTQVQSAMPSKDTFKERERVVRELAVVHSDVILGFGAGYEEVFASLQHDYPHIKFALLGGEVKEREPNLVSVAFEDQQSAFLAGVAAALATNTGKLAFLGGWEVEGVLRQQLGFEAGIYYANAHYGTAAQLAVTSYAGTFSDYKQGRKLAQRIYGEGVDTMFACAGLVGAGALEVTEVLAEQGRTLWFIGTDADQSKRGENVVLTSTLKRLDLVIYELLQSYIQGYFPAGQHLVKGLSNGGVSLSEASEPVAALADLLRSGALVVPFDLEELKAFVEVQKHPR